MTGGTVELHGPGKAARSPLRHPVLRSGLISCGSLLMWGGWAGLANRAHGLEEVLAAAATQGFASFTVTFLMTLLMEGAARRLGQEPARAALVRVGGVAAAGIGFHLLYTLGLHLLNGTPELLLTLAPNVAVSVSYSLAYAANLERERRSALPSGAAPPPPVPRL